MAGMEQESNSCKKGEKKLTDGNFSDTAYSLSRDGKKIVLSRAPTPRFGDSDQSEVFVTDASGAGEIQLTHNRVAESNIEISPDNSQVLFTAGANRKFETYYNSNLFVVPSGGGEARLLLPEAEYQEATTKPKNRNSELFRAYSSDSSCLCPYRRWRSQYSGLPR